MHPLINLAIVFAVIILLLGKKVPLGFVMLIAAVLLGILFQVNLWQQILAVKQAIISPVFFQLGVALNIIMFLEHVLRTKDYLNKTVNALKVLIPNPKINVILLPAFLGLLPSPGGAVFSAPLVAEAGSELNLSPELKSQVNYWFRHLWEYFIPLYPGVILASKILNVTTSKISLCLIWFFFIALFIGYLLIIRQIQTPHITLPKSSQLAKGKAFVNLLAGIWPVISIVLMVLFLSLDVGLTVSIVLLLLLLIHQYGIPDLKKLWRESFSLSLISLIAGILIFKEMLVISGVVQWLPAFLHSLGIPNLFVVICLPFFMGFATGMSQAYIATSFPLILGIIGSGGNLFPGMLILAFISGFVGLMISPMHLCLVLTVDYFKADFIKVLRKVILPEILLLITAILFALFWK